MFIRTHKVRSAITPITICPLGDLQWAGDEEDIAYDLLEEHIGNCLEHPNPLMVGMGDYPVPLRARALTRRGFITHDQLIVGESVLAYNLATSHCEWTPIRRVVYPGTQPTVALHSRSFRGVCTPAHTWVTTHNYVPTASPQLLATKDLKKQHRLIIAAPVEDEPESVLNAEEASVLGWLCTDGNLRIQASNPCGYIVQTKEPTRTMLRGMLAEWITKEEIREPAFCSHCPHCQKFKGPKTRKHSSAFHLKTKRLRQLFETAGLPLDHKYKQHLPALVTRLSQEARVAMLSAMTAAEGWRQRGGRWWFSQKPGPVLEAYKILGTLLGYRLSRGKTNRQGVHQVLLMQHRVVTVADLQFSEQPAEDVFCLGTDLGSWVMECDGQITITGNTDFASPSMRRALETHVTYDTAKKVIADKSKALIDDLYRRLLKPTRGKWGGLTQGHHHHVVKVEERKDGTVITEDSDVYLAKLLDAPWLDEMGVIKVVFPGGGVFRILAFHGSGSSVFPWGPLVKLYRLMPHFHVDLMLMGHMTKKTMGEIDRLTFPEDTDDIRHQTIKMVGTGGWMKGYINARRTYVSTAGLGPVTLGQPLIHLRPRVRKGQWEPMVTVES